MAIETLDRRRFLGVMTALGLGQTMLPGALLAVAAQEPAGKELPRITVSMIDQAAAIAGLTIADDLKAAMVDGLSNQRDDVAQIERLGLRNEIAPAVVFDPVPGRMVLDTAVRAMRMSAAPRVVFEDHDSAEKNAEALAFLTVRELADLVKAKRVSSVTLTRMYLARLKRYDAKLKFVINLTEQRALRQAAAMDAEIAAGTYRGPLHGIPWGAKDLLAVAGYPTTWGAAGFETQTFDDDAEVVKRLDAAGAVLVAKLAMGALAQGDLWFGGRCRNPWDPMQGSSGSSAGSASAVAAGCVGFAIGTETLGSISSPSTRCGATGLRPSYGFVPRTGAMALSWSMDKIGPIARCVEDCALVLGAIYGPDGKDLAVQRVGYSWDAEFDWRTLRVGYLKSAFEAPVLPELKAPTAGGEAEMESYRKQVARRGAGLTRALYDLTFAQAALEVLRGKMGVPLVPVEMPKLPFGSMVPLLEAEAAAAFDELTRSGRDKLLTGQQTYDWPNQFRVARFYSAVDYIQAMRARTLALAAMDELFRTVDVIVTPSQGVQLTATNMTGQPAVIVPNGVRGADAPPSANPVDGAVDNAGGPGTPVSITFLGGLYQDAKLAAFARGVSGCDRFPSDASGARLMLLEATGLTKEYAGKRVVDGVSLAVAKGETLGLVGESGSGKSTVARMMLRLVEPTTGRVVFDGVNVLAAGSKELRGLRRRMQMVFQDPFAALNPTMQVKEIVAEPFAIQGGFSREQVRGRVMDLMGEVGLDASALSRFPHEFSGGQRQRINIARALALRPEFLALDEPVSALDVSVGAQVINLLKDLQRRHGLTYLFISHSMPLVRYLCDRVAVMQKGRLIEVGDAVQVCERPQQEYTKRLVGATPEMPVCPGP